MVGMSTYDETKHPRGGNPVNTGEYSEKSNSAPEGTLPATSHRESNTEYLEGAIGFTFRAENYSEDDVIPAMKNSMLRLELASIDTTDPREAIVELADTLNLDLTNEYTYDSDAFPKPVFTDQLTCSDRSWAGESAPAHEMLGKTGEHQSCMYCGYEVDGVITSWAA